MPVNLVVEGRDVVGSSPCVAWRPGVAWRCGVGWWGVVSLAVEGVAAGGGPDESLIWGGGHGPAVGVSDAVMTST